MRDPAAVVDAVAAVFRVTARPGLSLEESLVAYLRDQRLLVVLDNCEHVLRPVAAVVTAIEAGCPRVRVLATSREGLSVRGEQIWAVPSLEVPDDSTSPDAVSACEAVRLFVDRAQGVKANFAVDATNAEGVAQVCRRLDGVPLAIELAAARITTMKPADLARRLDRRFRLLTGGDRVAIERHQTLRATIDWSYDLLSEPEQRLLDRLSMFAGGCTLEAAEAVCAGDPIDADDVYELLANLVARSLVVADDTGAEMRYRLLETIRQYGEERLAEAGDTDRLRTRHCDHYTELAGVVRGQSYGAGQVEWGARLAREHENLLVAMAFALATQDAEQRLGPTPGSKLAMFSSWLRAGVANDAGAQREAADHYLDASRQARADDLPGMTAYFLGGAANVLGWLDPPAAVAPATEGLALARQTGMPIAISNNLIGLAQALGPDDPDQARALLDEALELAATLGYENPAQLLTAVFAAARLDDWPTTLRTASRVLHHQLRSSGISPLYLAGTLNLVARGLAPHGPEPAAVIQGTVGVVLRRVTHRAADPAPVGSAQPNTAAAFIAEARHDTTRLLVSALGEPRMRELRAQGAAMNEDQACTYTRTHIDEYLATMEDETT